MEPIEPIVEVVKIHIATVPELPIWPQDHFTDAWLAGIAEARAKADTQPDLWDLPSADDSE